MRHSEKNNVVPGKVLRSCINKHKIPVGFIFGMKIRHFLANIAICRNCFQLKFWMVCNQAHQLAANVAASTSDCNTQDHLLVSLQLGTDLCAKPLSRQFYTGVTGLARFNLSERSIHCPKAQSKSKRLGALRNVGTLIIIGERDFFQ